MSSTKKCLAKTETDPYLWLEEVSSEKSLAFAREQNSISEQAITSDPRFAKTFADLKEIAFAADRIPGISMEHNYVYNFWKDKEHVRGIWRRAERVDFDESHANPNWDILLDLDKLAATEGRNWIWAGADCNRSERCLISLSDGGKDAVVVREFDLPTKSFVADGFILPEGKPRLCWRDENSLFVGLTGSEDLETTSGYPRQVRLWQRGTPVANAPVVFSGERTDVSVVCSTMDNPEGKWYLFTRNVDFFHAKYSIQKSDGDIIALQLPERSKFYNVIDGKLIVALDLPATIGGKSFTAGSVLAFPLDNMELPQLVFAPTGRTFVESIVRIRSGLLVELLDNVSAKLRLYTSSSEGWRYQEFPVPQFSAGSVSAADSFSNDFYYIYQSFLVPPTLHAFSLKGGARASEATSQSYNSIKVRELSPKFSASNLVAEQYEAKSADGTMVPYFVVRRSDLSRNGANPTLLYGYGGFQLSFTPSYASWVGKAWLERGGVYVLANIRGGGEFGPEWHTAALKENRQRAFDDFIAVAEDLIAKKITSPQHLAIRGGSNGGLLVGAVMVQRPDLFKAVVCDVPLLDMFRYHKLLAGASWQGEYGNVEEDTAAAAAIRRYSPYQNVKAGAAMPTVFFTTSTKDDRVHPGHARKMTARMLEQNHKVYLYENIEGGHGGAANQEQASYMEALRYGFLLEQLMPN